MTVCRGGIQQLSCHAQSQSVPVPGGGKVIEDLSLRVFFAEIPRYPRDRPLTAAENTPDTAGRRCGSPFRCR